MHQMRRGFKRIPRFKRIKAVRVLAGSAVILVEEEDLRGFGVVLQTNVGKNPALSNVELCTAPHTLRVQYK